MDLQGTPDHHPDAAGHNPVQTLVVPRSRDIGGFEVRRVLPSIQRRMVGPFVFLDHMGPTPFTPGEGLDVRPHPHIGLATVTYLLEGSILHRDSLGSRQPILPGAVNWMTAGRGIVHSERTGAEERAAGQVLHGLQYWVALPQAAEEMAPAFAHHDAATLPLLEGEGVTLRIIAGSGYGRQAPVAVPAPLFMFDVALQAGARFVLPAEHEERALYLVSGTVAVEGVEFTPGQLLVLEPGRAITLAATQGPARLSALGGAPLDGPRHIWWNFVSSRKDRIEEAKLSWERDQFHVAVPEEHEFIPLPRF